MGNTYPIKVNETARIANGEHEGVVGTVVSADLFNMKVTVESSAGQWITVPWMWVEQFRD